MNESRKWLEEAMECKTKGEAKKFLDEYLPLVIQTNKCDEEEAMKIALSNIAYFAGYYNLDTRQRMESLFGGRHPILGSSFGPQPTLDEVFQMGVEWGESGGKHVPTLEKMMEEALIDGVVEFVTKEE